MSIDDSNVFFEFSSVYNLVDKIKPNSWQCLFSSIRLKPQNNLFDQSHSDIFFNVAMETVQVVGHGGGGQKAPLLAEWDQSFGRAAILG